MWPQQLLWIDALLKLGVGIALVAAPTLLQRLSGLPAASSFWLRLLGGVLAGLAFAIVIGDGRPRGSGLGHAGLFALNGTVALTVLMLAFSGAAGGTRRGRIIAYGIAGLLGLLALLELSISFGSGTAP